MPSRSVPFGEALRRGFGLAWRSPGVVGLGFLASLAGDLLALGVGVSAGALLLRALAASIGSEPWLLAFDPEAAGRSFLGHLLQSGAWVPVAGAALVAGLLSLALRLLWYSAGARAFGLRLAGEEPSADAPTRWHRAVLTAALFLPVYAAVALYNLAALGSASLAYAQALATEEGGVAGAFALALAVALGALLSFLADALLRLALIRAVAGDVGPVDAVSGAMRILGSHVGTIVLLLLAFGFLQGFAGAIGASGGALLVGTGTAAVALALAARAATGVVGSLAAAFLATAQLGAFAALDAGDRGVLPEPPPPPPPPRPVPAAPVLTAQPILDTQLLTEKPLE